MYRPQKGFTLIEILLVVAAIAILAGIVIVAINPAKQLAATRDASRNSAVNAILNGVSQAAVGGATLPTFSSAACDATGATTGQKICKVTYNGTAVVCPSGGVDLSTLVPTYVADLPADPSFASDAFYTGYYISKNAGGRYTVCASPETAGAVVSVTR